MKAEWDMIFDLRASNTVMQSLASSKSRKPEMRSAYKRQILQQIETLHGARLND